VSKRAPAGIDAADAFFAIFGMTRVGPIEDCHITYECAHAFGAETSKRFRGVDRRMYKATFRTCAKCGERSETCLLVKGDEVG
jgi:predicted GNAT superfamily acetyltransferase